MTSPISRRPLGRLAMLLGLGALLVCSGGALAAPAKIPDTPLDLELNEADVKEVFQLLGDVSGRPLALDPCVSGKVDLKLQNAPLPLVFDLLASKLDLRYEDHDGSTTVRCGRAAPTAAEAALDQRVTVETRDTALMTVLDGLAKGAGLAGARSAAFPVDRVTEEPHVTVTLRGVRLSTALAVIADETGAAVRVERDRIVASY
jgi:hypothetical protein